MSTKQTQTETICCNSLPCAAALMTAGFALVKVHPVAGGRCELFLEGDGVEAASYAYFTRRLEGNLADFMQNFDVLRTAVRQSTAVAK